MTYSSFSDFYSSIKKTSDLPNEIVVPFPEGVTVCYWSCNIYCDNNASVRVFQVTFNSASTSLVTVYDFRRAVESAMLSAGVPVAKLEFIIANDGNTQHTANYIVFESERSGLSLSGGVVPLTTQQIRTIPSGASIRFRWYVPQSKIVTDTELEDHSGTHPKMFSYYLRVSAVIENVLTERRERIEVTRSFDKVLNANTENLTMKNGYVGSVLWSTNKNYFTLYVSNSSVREWLWAEDVRDYQNIIVRSARLEVIPVVDVVSDVDETVGTAVTVYFDYNNSFKRTFNFTNIYNCADTLYVYATKSEKQETSNSKSLTFDGIRYYGHETTGKVEYSITVDTLVEAYLCRQMMRNERISVVDVDGSSVEYWVDSYKCEIDESGGSHSLSVSLVPYTGTMERTVEHRILQAGSPLFYDGHTLPDSPYETLDYGDVDSWAASEIRSVIGSL